MNRRRFFSGVGALGLLGAFPRNVTAQRLSIAVFSGPGVGSEALALALAAIEASGMSAVPVTPDEVRAGVLERHHAALFTGGRGSFQGRALAETGRERVREAVRAGLGYVGICGGSFLALQGAPEFHKLGMVAARHATGDAWMRGIGPAVLTPTDGSAPVTLHYANGPLFSIETVPDLRPPTVLARFCTEYALPEHETHLGEMLDAPGLLSARYGEGRIVLFSPNPNLEPARPELLIRALEACSRGSANALASYREIFIPGS